MSDPQILFTNRTILQSLKRHGPSTAEQVAKRTNMSQIIHNFFNLKNLGYVAVTLDGDDTTYLLTEKAEALWFLEGIQTREDSGG